MNNRLWQNLDFNQLQALSLVIHNLTGAPSTPVEGQKYMNTTTHLEYTWNGTAWINDLDRANHSGTQLANTISDFNTAVRTNRLDQMAAPTSAVSMNSQKITSVGTPTVSTDAVNMQYVDDLLNWTDWKASARAATVANVTLSWLQTIDGISLIAGERILVKNQTTASENWIYLVASGAWTRSLDADTDWDLTSATALFIEEWTTLADTQWRITTDWAIVIWTTAITFEQFWASTSYTAWNGIDITGTVIKVDPTVTVRKYAVDIWDTSNTSFTITHNLNTLDIQVSVREISTGEEVIVPNKASSVNEAVVEFAVAPSTDEYRVIVQG